jgi:hypothetical protein
MKELYEVEINDFMYVMAENAGQAEHVAQSHIHEVNSNVNAYLATSYYAEWENIQPYNADDDDTRTVKEIVEQIIATKKKAKYIKAHYRELPFNKTKETKK